MFTLPVEPRTKTVSNHALRKKGLVPAVYFHKGEASENLTVSMKDLTKALLSHDPVLQLSNSKMAVIQDIQKDPVSLKVLHVSLHGVVAGETFEKSVPVVLTHSEGCNWQKQGMHIVQQMKEVVVKTTPENVPEKIVVDVSNLEKGQTLSVKDLTMPANVTCVEDEDTIVATLAFAHNEEEEPSTPEPSPTPETSPKP